MLYHETFRNHDQIMTMHEMTILLSLQCLSNVSPFSSLGSIGSCWIHRIARCDQGTGRSQWKRGVTMTLPQA